MDFLALLIVLALLQVWGELTPYQNDTFFQRWHEFCVARIPSLPWRYVTLLLLPPFLVVVILELFGGLLWHGVGLAVTVLMLCYSLGRGTFNQHLKDYAAQWQEGSRERALLAIQALKVEVDIEREDSDAEVHGKVLGAIAVASLRRLFCVVFWFLLLGVEAALLYRLSLLMLECVKRPTCINDPMEKAYTLEVCGKVRDVMEWPAIRLMALTFAVSRKYHTVFSVWWQNTVTVPRSGQEILQACMTAALADADIDDQQLNAKVAKQTNALQHLLNRSLIVAIAISGFLFIL